MRGAELDGIGIANQRETVVAWDPATGEPIHRALVWQDRRTADRCEELKAAGTRPWSGSAPASSSTPTSPGPRSSGCCATSSAPSGRCSARSTPGSSSSSPAATPPTTPTPRERCCSTSGGSPGTGSCARCSGSTRRVLPEPLPSAHLYGTTSEFGGEVPVAGIAGDQQAALFGQACHRAGMAKNTYGTGSFVLLHTGDAAPAPSEGLLTTIACGAEEESAYALEAAIFVTGAAVQWLRDGLGIVGEAAETEAMAASLAGNDGVYFVPALTGLGSPLLGPLRAGDDRRADAGDAARAPGPRHPGGDRLRDGRRGARSGGGRGRAARGAEGRRRRGRQPLVDAVPGRRAGGAGGGAGDRRDDGARRRLPGRESPPGAGAPSRWGRCGARPPATSRGWGRRSARRCSPNGAARSSAPGTGQAREARWPPRSSLSRAPSPRVTPPALEGRHQRWLRPPSRHGGDEATGL